MSAPPATNGRNVRTIGTKLRQHHRLAAVLHEEGVGLRDVLALDEAAEQAGDRRAPDGARKRCATRAPTE